MQSGNTNQGLRAARGEYVRILHSDDMISQNCIDFEIQLFEKYPDINVIYHDTRPFVDTIDFNEHKRSHRLHIKDVWLDNIIFKDTLLPSSICFKRGLIKKEGLLDEKYKFICDWDFWFRLLLNEYKEGRDIVTIPSGYVGWRNHGESISSTLSLTLFYEHIDFFNKLITIYRKEQLLPEKNLKEKLKIIENYRYTRILNDYKKYNNFKLPHIPMKYRLRKTLNFLERLMCPFIALHRWIRFMI